MIDGDHRKGASSMTCEPCSLYTAGDTARASAIDAIRCNRLILAMLNGAEDAAGEIAAEVGECRDCVARLTTILLGMVVGQLAHVFDGTEPAANYVEQHLVELIDQQT
jgi:hypothetical protein